MRGVLVEEFTEFVNLKLVECPEPDIRPKQVRIRVQATGVSFAHRHKSPPTTKAI